LSLCGIAAELAARSEKCVLSREGAIATAPRTAPACARSPALALTLVAAFTLVRPNWLAGMLTTPFATRALRYKLVTSVRATLTAPNPRP
jgi:hypothetical protein